LLEAKASNHLSPLHFRSSKGREGNRGKLTQGKMMIQDKEKSLADQNTQDELLDRNAAAKYLGGIKPQTLAVWDCNKRYDLKPIKIGKLVRYKRSVLDAFIKERMTP
jgi:hypothetical protein